MRRLLVLIGTLLFVWCLLVACCGPANAQSPRVITTAEEPVVGDPCDPRRFELFLGRISGSQFWCDDVTDPANPVWAERTAPVAGSIPAGIDEAFQFNDAGALAGSIAATYNTGTEKTRVKILNDAHSAAFYATGGDGTSGNPWTGWSTGVSAGRQTVFQKGYYRITAATTVGNGTQVVCADGATLVRHSSALAVSVFSAAGAISNAVIQGCTFDTAGLAVSAVDVLIPEGSTSVTVRDNTWINIDANRAPAATLIRAEGNSGTAQHSDISYIGNKVYASGTLTGQENSFQMFSTNRALVQNNLIVGYGSIKVESRSADVGSPLRDVKIIGNSFLDVNPTNIFVRVLNAGEIENVLVMGNHGVLSTSVPPTKGLVGIGTSTGTGGIIRNVLVIGNTGRGYDGNFMGGGDPNSTLRDFAFVGNSFDGSLPGQTTVDANSLSTCLRLSSDTAQNGVIKGNACRNTGRSCLSVSGAVITIEGNTLSYCQQNAVTSPDPSQESGIFIFNDATDIDVKGNMIYNPHNATLAASYVTAGITLAHFGTVSGIEITNNTIIEDRVGTEGMEHGIKVGSSGATTMPAEVSVTDNKISGASVSPIVESGTGTHRIWGNRTAAANEDFPVERLSIGSAGVCSDSGGNIYCAGEIVIEGASSQPVLTVQRAGGDPALSWLRVGGQEWRCSVNSVGAFICSDTTNGIVTLVMNDGNGRVSVGNPADGTPDYNLDVTGTLGVSGAATFEGIAASTSCLGLNSSQQLIASTTGGCSAASLPNSFTTVNTSSGIDPVADTTTDTLDLTGTAPIVVTGTDDPESATISMAASTTSVDGYLTAADWTTFNAKQSATAPGNTEEVIFNNAGVLGADSALKVNPTTNDVTMLDDLTVNSGGLTNQAGLALHGFFGTAGTGRPGFINFFHRTTSKAFCYVNTGGVFTCEATNASGAGDVGFFGFDVATGAATFGLAVTQLATDASDLGGPVFIMNHVRSSGTPGAGSIAGGFKFQDHNSASATKIYAGLSGRVVDPTSTSEDGMFRFGTAVAGTQDTTTLEVSSAGLNQGDNTDTDQTVLLVNRLTADTPLIGWDESDAAMTLATDWRMGTDTNKLNVSVDGTGIATFDSVGSSGTQGYAFQCNSGLPGLVIDCDTPSVYFYEAPFGITYSSGPQLEFGEIAGANGNIRCTSGVCTFDSTTSSSWAYNIATVPIAAIDTSGVKLQTLGDKYHVKEGSNGCMGRDVLGGGVGQVTVSTTCVTATSEIFLTTQIPGGTPGFVYVGTRTAATSFRIDSLSASDTSTVAWVIVDPSP